ncbi:cysteine desulfurase [Parachlamydia acanthamoebae UV-7]|uniref:Cysteine desulfurase n=2 Tax=Parachlamydia acanthamoebae TaxID=83552 RepID=F8KXR6_PARAV|nr:aminotransferase class V-fold PLP-dependent enzyme [Parachlamydia acanthamoebae]KIA78640.1 Cysteine desulfurase [Parachlamydia acanthamoebae]CCB85646.1 cysteine desulfurase [Parachlamydia acanthamoebae UV-7]
MPNGIYLDNNLVTRPSKKAVSEMLPFLTDRWGTPSAPHRMGQELFPAMSESYKALYALIDAKEVDDIIFTSSGEEAVNHVFTAAFHDIMLPTGRNQLICANQDEAPALMAIGRLEQHGCVGKFVSANQEGRVTAEEIADHITPRTALVSLSWANGLTGVINPVHEIGALCQQRGIKFHLDATHVLGKLFFNLEDVQADFITFSGDRFHAPKGTGGLYIKAGVKCSSFILGGLEQGGLRAGNLNVPALVALAAAAKEAVETRDLMCTEIARLRNKLETGIKESYPEAVLFFDEQERLPHTTTIAFPGIANEALLYALNRQLVFASIGGGSFQQIGLVLAASGINPQLAHSALSFSLSRETTEDEIDRATWIVTETAKYLRRASQKILK